MKGGILAFALLSLVMATAVGLFFSRGGERNPAKMQIGVPDDSGGLIVHYILREKGFAAAEAVRDFELFSLKDCCAATSEWALGSDRLDMAVMCPDAAQRLVEKNRKFEIEGPVLFNSSVLVIRRGKTAARIGIAHKRQVQERFIKERYHDACTTVPMLPAGLPLAFERGFVDGVVVDALNAFAVSGERIPFAGNGADVVTYVLVARREPMSRDAFRRFMELFEQAVEELRDVKTLAHAVEKYKELRWTEREMEEWKAWRVKFACPLKPGE